MRINLSPSLLQRHDWTSHVIQPLLLTLLVCILRSITYRILLQAYLDVLISIFNHRLHLDSQLSSSFDAARAHGALQANCRPNLFDRLPSQQHCLNYLCPALTTFTNITILTQSRNCRLESNRRLPYPNDVRPRARLAAPDPCGGPPD